MNSNSSEYLEQKKFINWCKRNEHIFADLEFVYSNPNEGLRAHRGASKMIATGLKSGVPDLFIPIPIGKYHGMYIEMKYKDNTVSDNQDYWLTNLSRLGYYTCICYSAIEAQQQLINYIQGKV